MSDREFRPLESPDLGLESDAWLERLREARRAELLGRVGPYELLREVGRGGQGIVYRARDTRSGTLVALKLLRVNERDPSGVHARLRNEVAAMRALSHEGVVRVFGIESYAGGLLIAMEWIEGQPLAEWAQSRKRDAHAVAHLMARICDVMQHAHDRGVVHRDLKPSNVLVDGNGAPRLLDFGLAKLDPGTSRGGPASSPFLGTLAYAAPELISLGPNSMDGRSDIYSLGVMFHEILTGALPYNLGGSISTAVTAILQARPSGLDDPRVDARLREVLRRSLAKAPQDRYVDAAGMRDDLNAFVGAGDDPVMSPRSRTASRGRRVASVLACALALAGILAAALTLERSRTTPAPSIPAGPTAVAPDQEDAMRRELDAMSARIEAQGARSPLAEAASRTDLAWRYFGLGDWAHVASEAARARALLDAEPEIDERVYAGALTLLASSYVRTSLGDPVPLLERAIDIGQNGTAPDPLVLGEAYASRALVRSARGAYLEAEADWGRAFDHYDRVAGVQTGEVRAMIGYARMKSRLKESEAAARAYERGLASMAALPHFRRSDMAAVLIEYGDLLRSMCRLAESERTYRRSIDVREGATDVRLPISLSKYGSVLLQRGAAAEAESSFTAAIRARLDLLASDHPDEPRFRDYSRNICRSGLQPADIVPIGQLLRKDAPPIFALFRHTTLELARARHAQGRTDDAASIRRQVNALDALSNDVLPPLRGG